MRSSTVEDFIEDLTLVVRELLTRGLAPRTIRYHVTKAIKAGSFTETPIFTNTVK